MGDQALLTSPKRPKKGSPDRESIQRFLDAVGREIGPIGVADRLDVERVLQSHGGARAAELRDALPALLARNADELDRVQRLYDVHCTAREAPGVGAVPEKSPPETENKAPEPPPAEKKPPAGRRWRVFALAVTSALVLASLVWATRGYWMNASSGSAGSSLPETSAAPEDSTHPAEPVTPHKDDTPALSATSEVVQPARTVEHLRPGRTRTLDDGDWLVFLLTIPLLFLGVRWSLLPVTAMKRTRAAIAARTARARTERDRLTVLAAARGEPIRLSYNVPLYMPFKPHVLDDTATILGRAGPREPGSELDIPRTVTATIRAGGRIIPVLEQRRAARAIVVLVDEERGDHPFLGGLLRTLDRLEHAGVSMHRFRFQMNPGSLLPERGGPPTSIVELSRRFAGASLVIFSRKLSPQSRTGDAEWTAALAAWPLKAWMDLDPRPLHERREDAKRIAGLAEIGLLRFPWSEAGLLALAGYVQSEGESRREVAPVDLPSLEDAAVDAALRRWAVCASLVPDADWDQLEAIRRHPDFKDIGGVLSEPAHLQRLLDWTARFTGDAAESEDGRTLSLPLEKIDVLIREQRRRERDAATPLDQSLEARARRLLLQQLEAARPESELRRLRWELKMALHRAILEPARAVEVMETFLGTAVEDELLSTFEAEIQRQAEGVSLPSCLMTRGVLKRLSVLEGKESALPVRDLFVGNGGLWRPGLLGAVLGVMLLSLGIGLILKVEPFARIFLGEPEQKVILTLPEIRARGSDTKAAPPSSSSATP